MSKIIKARISTISVRKARKRIYFLILELNLLPSDLLNDGRLDEKNENIRNNSCVF